MQRGGAGRGGTLTGTDTRWNPWARRSPGSLAMASTSCTIASEAATANVCSQSERSANAT